MMQVLTLAKKDQPETEEQRQHAETANNNDGTAAEPFAAAHEGPLAAGEASSRSDGQDDRKSGVAILSQLLGNTASDLDLEIARLKAQREEMKKSKKRCAAELKNTERKRTRLKNRAKLLSTNDLLEVCAMRSRSKEVKETKAKAQAQEPVPAAAGVSKKQDCLVPQVHVVNTPNRLCVLQVTLVRKQPWH